MGENEHQKHPLVVLPTQSVDSKPRIRLKSNSTSTHEICANIEYTLIFFL